MMDPTQTHLAFRYAIAVFCAVLLGTLILPAQSLAQESSIMLEEILVTARKREEGLQNTPIAVSAFSADSLEAKGITRINRLQDLTPNLVFQNTPSNSGVGSNAAVFIRGIGQKDFAPTTEPGVGIYIDGVYLARTVGSVFDLIDIEQVEILRGPQGTLFGRNTIGGAINITTKAPNEEFGGVVDVKVGTDSRLNLRGALNVPLSDTLFARVSLASFQQDGYVTRPFDGLDLGDQDNQNARLAVRWLASDALTFDMTAEYGKDKSNGPPIVITRIDTPDLTPDSFATGHNAFAGMGNPFACFAAGAPAACYNQNVIGGRNTNHGSGPSYSDLETNGLSLTAKWEADNFEMKSIIAFRSIEGSFAQDRDGGTQQDGVQLTPNPAGPVRNPLNHVFDTFEQDQFSWELQFQGTLMEERLNWLLGLYYFEEDGENLNNVDFFPVSIQSGGFFDYTSKAAFAQATYAITDPLSLTLGIRYTEDDRDYLADQFFEELPLGPLGFPCFDPGFHIPCTVGDRVVPFETVNNSIDEVTPYINLSLQANDNLLLYASYSEGFKSDGFTQRVFPPEPSLPEFAPEYVDSYELGFKGDLMDGRMRLNGALFYSDYTDLQLLVADASRIGPFITNAGKATMQGAELELNFIPAEGWRFDFSVGYLDSEYDEVSPGAQAAGLTPDSPFVLISDWNISASVDKTIQLENGSRLIPRIDWSWRSEFYTNANGIPFRPGIAEPLFQPDYSLVNLSMSWTSATEAISITAGVDNATDEEFRIFGDYQPGFGFDMEAFDRGRQWYLLARYSF